MYPVSFRSDTYQQTWKNMKQAPKEEKTQKTQTRKHMKIKKEETKP